MNHRRVLKSMQSRNRYMTGKIKKIFMTLCVFLMVSSFVFGSTERIQIASSSGSKYKKSGSGNKSRSSQNFSRKKSLKSRSQKPRKSSVRKSSKKSQRKKPVSNTRENVYNIRAKPKSQNRVPGIKKPQKWKIIPKEEDGEKLVPKDKNNNASKGYFIQRRSNHIRDRKDWQEYKRRIQEEWRAQHLESKDEVQQMKKESDENWKDIRDQNRENWLREKEDQQNDWKEMRDEVQEQFKSQNQKKSKSWAEQKEEFKKNMEKIRGQYNHFDIIED